MKNANWVIFCSWAPVNNISMSLKYMVQNWKFDHLKYQRSVDFERTFWFFQFFQNTSEKFLPQEARAKIEIFKFIFWKNWKHQNFLSRLTDLYNKYYYTNDNNNNRVHIFWKGHKNMAKSPNKFWTYYVTSQRKFGDFVIFLWLCQNIWTLLEMIATIMTLNHPCSLAIRKIQENLGAENAKSFFS